MKCLKCGRETEQTFCETCRADMERNPVKPGTILLLPKERKIERKPQTWHPQVPLETVVKGQRRLIRRLSRGIAVLTALLLLLAGFTIRLLSDSNARPVGQNYSAVTKPSDETTESSQLASDATAPAELEDFTKATD